MATIDDISGVLRLDAGVTGYARAERLTTWVNGRVEAIAGRAPAAVKTRAVAQWTAYLFDAPTGAVANAYHASGAAALLRPWVPLRGRKIA